MKFESFEQINKIKKDNNDNSENILIITTINENKTTKHAHYSAIKGFFLAKGLLEKGYTIFILSNENNITLYNYYYYINYNLLSSKILSSFKCVFFCLHNKEIITPLFERTEIFKNLVKAKSKNKNLLIINKTCQYPSTIDELKINSYVFFDYIYLQTEDICVPKYLVESLIKFKMHSPLWSFPPFNLNRCKLNTFNSLCDHEKLYSKIFSSEMTFDINNIRDYNIPFTVNKDFINIVYLGRLMGSNGMDILYLIKLMKKLGKKYKLYIIPGSFVLPTLWPLKKKSASKYHLELKNFVEKYELTWNDENLKALKKYPKENYMPEKDDYNICNIEVLQQFEYGDHFKILKQMDIAIGFCETKHQKVPQGSSKLFDYMCCNLKIAFEDGWNNTKYISKYNFGKCLSTNSTVNEAVDAIHELEKMPKEKIKYNAFVEDHNYSVRVKKIMNQIGLSGSNDYHFKKQYLSALIIQRAWRLKNK